MVSFGVAVRTEQVAFSGLCHDFRPTAIAEYSRIELKHLRARLPMVKLHGCHVSGIAANAAFASKQRDELELPSARPLQLSRVALVVEIGVPILAATAAESHLSSAKRRAADLAQNGRRNTHHIDILGRSCAHGDRKKWPVL
jgi:hypothetical protein